LRSWLPRSQRTVNESLVLHAEEKRQCCWFGRGRGLRYSL